MMKGMVLGFTGTRAGLTATQRTTLGGILPGLAPGEFHHGGARGADAQASRMVRGVCDKVICHPCKKDNSSSSYYTVRLPEKPCLERNKDIVETCQVLIACPKGRKEELRSGTWATVRWARKLGRKILFIWPDGDESREG